MIDEIFKDDKTRMTVYLGTCAPILMLGLKKKNQLYGIQWVKWKEKRRHIEKE